MLWQNKDMYVIKKNKQWNAKKFLCKLESMVFKGQIKSFLTYIFHQVITRLSSAVKK